MVQIDLRKHSKYFFIGSFIAIFALSLYLIWPFVTALLGSVILTYVFYPIYKKLLRIIRNKHLCALIMSILVIVVFTVPMIFAANTILNEASGFFLNIDDISFKALDEKFFAKYFGENIEIGAYVKNVLSKLSVTILKATENFILTIPQKIIALFVMLFTMYYLFKDGKKWGEMIKDELPLKERYKKGLARRFNATVYATLYGVILTAIIQGAVGALGLYIFGVSSPILWGIVMTILAMLPFVGAAFVWFPAAVYKFAIGDTFNGVGLFVYGLLIVSTIDNIIRPKLIGEKGKIHPVLVLLGVLGGLKVFGLIGIIIGPLSLAILMVFFELYLSEKNEIKG